MKLLISENEIVKIDKEVNSKDEALKEIENYLDGNAIFEKYTFEDVSTDLEKIDNIEYCQPDWEDIAKVIKENPELERYNGKVNRVKFQIVK